MSGKAWIIAEDPTLVGPVGDAIHQHMGWESAPISFSQIRRGDCPLGSAEALIWDLRSAEGWETLQAVEANFADPAWTRAARIGIVSQGCPVDRIALGDRLLTRIVRLPFPFALLDHLLGNGSVRQCRPLPEFRSLEGRTCKLLTYTPCLFKVVEELEIAAKHDYTIMLTGATGTGKTTLARLLHELSPRAEQRFVDVACGSLQKELINSELFGHVKGAFTGAESDKQGKFAVAAKGTILLDEIDTLDPPQQANLLKVIETGRIEPVGSNDSIAVDTRIIVASNQSLQKLVDSGHFREDLYYRLNQLEYMIPPLARRPLDVVPLTAAIIQESCREKRLTVQGVDPELIELVKAYDWPGNIRELRNELRRAVLFANGATLTVAHLTSTLCERAMQCKEQVSEQPEKSGLAGEVAHHERETIERMLDRYNNNRSATARALGISRVTLYNKIRKYGIGLKVGARV